MTKGEISKEFISKKINFELNSPNLDIKTTLSQCTYKERPKVLDTKSTYICKDVSNNNTTKKEFPFFKILLKFLLFILSVIGKKYGFQ
jgi:hypothetical protein